MKRIFVRKLFIFIILFVLFTQNKTQMMQAVNIDLYHETLKMDEEGNLCMTTHDKKATSNVTYRTLGWTLKRYSGDIIGNMSVRLKLEATGTAKTDPNDPNYIYNYFYCDKEEIFEKIESVSPEWAQELYTDGGTVYLDAIMTVVESGTVCGSLSKDGATSGEVYFTYYGIAAARGWNDPYALKTHFNKSVYFQGNPNLLGGTYVISYRELTDYNGNSEVPMTFLNLDEEGNLIKDKMQFQPAGLSEKRYEYVKTKVSEQYVEDQIRQKKVYEKNGSVTIDNQGGNYRKVVIIFYYRSIRSQDEIQFEYGNSYAEDENEIVIAAMPKSRSAFEVRDGIPTGEEVYARACMQNYYLSGVLLHLSGRATIPVDITVDTEVTEEIDGELVTHIESETYRCGVSREYSYYRFKNIDIYTLKAAQAENEAFAVSPLVLKDIRQPQVDLVMNRETYMEIRGVSGYLRGPVSHSQIQAYAESIAGEIRVRNDFLSIMGEVLLNGDYRERETSGLSLRQTPSMQTVESEGVNLPHTNENGNHVSRGYGIYESYQTREAISKKVKKINDLMIHTPVVCRGKCSNDIANNQQVAPTEHASLILGRDFYVGIDTYGRHRDILGYQTREYEKYTAQKQVRFPFEVYIGEIYYPQNTWIEIPISAHALAVYLPIGVREGDYLILFRTIAKNARTDKQIDSGEKDANWNLSSYSATDQMKVTVLGRVYDLAITNIVDYPRWQSVFAYDHRRYWIGKKNAEGMECPTRVRDGIFPILYGDHPYNQNAGPVGLGYRVLFQLKTIGNMRGETDHIILYPTYYYLTKDGKSRQKVCLYDAKTLKMIRPIVLLDAKNRSFLPVTHRNVSHVGIQQTSVQVWSGEYQLPADTRIVAASCDLDQYIRTHGNRISTHDSVFLKDGYLVVQFEILTVENGKWHLSYINPENEQKGYCNMWKRQGFSYERVDAHGTRFHFLDGDFLLFDLKQTLHRDYESWGTH